MGQAPAQNFNLMVLNHFRHPSFQIQKDGDSNAGLSPNLARQTGTSDCRWEGLLIVVDQQESFGWLCTNQLSRTDDIRHHEHPAYHTTLNGVIALHVYLPPHKRKHFKLNSPIERQQTGIRIQRCCF
jgi:hypothetical protein